MYRPAKEKYGIKEKKTEIKYSYGQQSYNRANFLGFAIPADFIADEKRYKTLNFRYTIDATNLALAKICNLMFLKLLIHLLTMHVGITRRF